MWPVGSSWEETGGTPVPSGTEGVWAGSEKLNSEVAVELMGSEEMAEPGVEADSVANRSTVGGEAGEARRLRPPKSIPTKSKNPHERTIPTIIQKVRLLIFMF